MGGQPEGFFFSHISLQHLPVGDFHHFRKHLPQPGIVIAAGPVDIPVEPVIQRFSLAEHAGAGSLAHQYVLKHIACEKH